MLLSFGSASDSLTASHTVLHQTPCIRGGAFWGKVSAVPTSLHSTPPFRPSCRHDEATGAAIAGALFEQQANALAATAGGDAKAILREQGMLEGYEWHVQVDREHMLLATNMRAALVRVPGLPSVLASRDDPRSARVVPVWEARWTDVLALELRISQAAQGMPPDVLVLHTKGGRGDAGAEAGSGWILSGFLAVENPEADVGAMRMVAFQPGTQGALQARSRLQAIRRRFKETSPAADALQAALPVRPGGKHVSGTVGLPEAPQVRPPRLPCISYRLQWRGDVDHRSGRPAMTAWRPVAPPGYAPVGDVIVVGSDEPPAPVATVRETPGALADGARPPLAAPADFILCWRDGESPGQPVSVWLPVAPPGYVAVGCVVVPRLEEPAPGAIRCVRADLCYEAAVAGTEPLWCGLSQDESHWPISLWTVDNDCGTFVTSRATRDSWGDPGRVFGVIGEDSG